jgi:hypothetical protein
VIQFPKIVLRQLDDSEVPAADLDRKDATAILDHRTHAAYVIAILPHGDTRPIDVTDADGCYIGPLGAAGTYDHPGAVPYPMTQYAIDEWVDVIDPVGREFLRAEDSRWVVLAAEVDHEGYKTGNVTAELRHGPDEYTDRGLYPLSIFRPEEVY